jgi:hypothetical protein
VRADATLELGTVPVRNAKAEVLLDTIRSDI